MHAHRGDDHQPSGTRDAGVITAVEMMFLLIFCLIALLFIGYVGRLHAAGITVANTSQAAARAASQAGSGAAAVTAAEQAVAYSGLSQRCDGGASAAVSWATSPSGTWQGGSVTVTVSCTVGNGSLSGIWAPGSRTIRMSDTQPVDRYQR
jgi:Flp pilus assembly protein TadG